ncbi:MAG: hypothetical protein BroJett030_06600 [Alphaproteobacteria bacterium]|nr:MAG: hypothetical protein BroJett030_06600 [Alphaproteobacteria bacterium]
MASDFIASKISIKELSKRAGEVRTNLSISDDVTLDIINLLEFDIVRLIPNFRLLVMPDSEMLSDDGHFQEAYATFDPPRIVVANSIYIAANESEPHARMVLAHELGHLMLHNGRIVREKAHNLATEAKKRGAYGPPLHNLKSRTGESQASKFAAFLLAPTNACVSLTSANEIAEKFQISLRSAEIRFTETDPLRRRLSGQRRKLPSAVLAFMREQEVRNRFKFKSLPEDHRRA